MAARSSGKSSKVTRTLKATSNQQDDISPSKKIDEAAFKELVRAAVA